MYIYYLEKPMLQGLTDQQVCMCVCLEIEKKGEMGLVHWPSDHQT